MRVVISTWSTDRNKGFDDYMAIDRELAGMRDVEITLVGRVPDEVRFRSIRVLPAQRRPGRELGLGIGEHTLETKHERVVAAPLEARLRQAALHLGEGSVERLAADGAARKCDGDILALVEERLPTPRLDTVCGRLGVSLEANSHLVPAAAG